MTTGNTKTWSKARVRFPDIPERTPDDMTSIRAIHLNGKSHSLRVHFADRPNTMVDAERYISRIPTLDMKGIFYPDLLIAFNADSDALKESNAYVISEQGKPPDFILEIASQKTRTFDRTTKRDIYAGLEIPEYWRFDENPTRANPGLAGDRLVDGEYQPIAIDVLPDGRLRGYSTVLNLRLEWHDGQLNFLNPETEAPIPSHEDEREARIQAEARASTAREARIQAEARANALEEELRRLRGE